MEKSNTTKKIVNRQVIEDMIINRIKYESTSEEESSSEEEQEEYSSSEEEQEDQEQEEESSSEEEYVFEKSLVPVWQMRQIKDYYDKNKVIAIPTKYNTKECIECIKKYVYGK